MEWSNPPPPRASWGQVESRCSARPHTPEAACQHRLEMQESPRGPAQRPEQPTAPPRQAGTPSGVDPSGNDGGRRSRPGKGASTRARCPRATGGASPELLDTPGSMTFCFSLFLSAAYRPEGREWEGGRRKGKFPSAYETRKTPRRQECESTVEF